MAKRPVFVIIDGHALIHRAFHALPPLQTKDGKIVNAVYGFTTILMRVFKELKPTYLVVAMDAPGKTFRHEAFPAYKAQRVKQPDELYAQIPLVEHVLQAFRIPVLRKSGVEADDLIGTLTDQVKGDNLETIIVTGDMDTLQLVNEHTKVYTLKRSINDTIVYDAAQVQARYGGLTPAQMIDYKALRGDPSDNIPGVKGIGEKGAIDLLQQFGTLETLYAELKKNSPKAKKISERVRRCLVDHEKDARLGKKLVTILKDVAIPFKLGDGKLGEADHEEVQRVFLDLEFRSLLPRVQEIPIFQRQGQLALDGSPSSDGLKPPADATYDLVDSEAALSRCLKTAAKAHLWSVDTETTSLNIQASRLLGISLSVKSGEAWYIDWRACADTPSRALLQKYLEDPKIKKAGHNIKYDLEMLHTVGLQLRGIAVDTMIASYLLSPGSRTHSLNNVVYSELGHEMIPIEALIGKGRQQRSMADVPPKDVAIYSGEDADFTLRLVEPLVKRLKEQHLETLFSNIEIPLIEVLALMEERGVKIDVPFLNKKSKEAAKKILQIQKKIYRLAGKTFNVSSPPQLREILFGRLKIPTSNIKKNKTGLSTAAMELDKLKGKHPIIDEIMTYRELTKLKSTYIDALPEQVAKSDGRVHTSFNQTIAATGRLSSIDPNLQNIPIRTPEGNEIRKAFIADAGRCLLSLDYSQIELRVVASLAKDQKMIAFFKSGEDIHRRTAAEIHGVPYEDVTKEMRYSAKEINFGVLYGMGAYGLSTRAGISFEEAQDFIQRYFSVFSGMKAYVDTVKEYARKQGFVETLFGRRRALPEIHSRMPEVRSAAERMAVNFPIQGTAADLMKQAMIAVHDELKAFGDRAWMVLQVHDELVFDVEKGLAEKVAKLVKHLMEGVARLEVPIHVDCEIGKNWGEMEELAL